MPWEKFLFNKNELSFTSLLDRNITGYQQQELSSLDLDLNFEVLTKPEDRFKLPNYHQNSQLSHIDYNNYLLIYVGLTDYKRSGYDLRVEQIFYENKELDLKVGLYSSANEFSLEIINFPYDLIKIKRTELDLTDQLIIKFTAGNKKILARKRLKLK